MMMCNILFAAAISFLPYFEARNSLALRALSSETDVEGGENDAVPTLPDMTKRVKCISCKGHGVLNLKEEDFGQLKGRIRSAKKIKCKCPVCNGSGRRTIYLDQDELKVAIARDYAKYREGHSLRGEVASGAYFFPKESTADKKTMRKITDQTGKVCSKCDWSGIETCKKCKGAGLLKCPNKNCYYGWSVTEEDEEAKNGPGESQGAYKSSRGKKPDYLRKISVEICEDCKGAGKIVCEECAGKGAVACKSCRGIGYKTK